MSTRLSLSVAATLLLACYFAAAAETPAPLASEVLAPDADAGANDDPKSWINELDDAEFARRQEASQRLMEAGKSVFPELERVALEGRREASGRAMEILEKHFQRGDDETKQAARAALERLSQAGNAGVVQRANNALNPPQQPADQPFGFFGGMPVMPNRNVQIQIAANNVNARRVHIRSVNGKREVEVEENGKKTKVQDGANGGIEAEITEKINGKEQVRKVSAKDLDDLKKKDADAARIYEQYQQGPNRIQIQAGRIQVGGAGGPPKESIERMIKTLDNQIQQLEGDAANNPANQRRIEAFKEHRKTLEQMLPVEKPAEDAPPEAKPAENN